MAKRTSTAIVPVYQQAPRQQAPIIRIATPRPVATKAPKKKPKHHKRRDGGGDSVKTMLGIVGGGAALGYIEKQSWISVLPSLPFVGRKGAIAIAAYFLHKKGYGGQIMRDIAIAAAAISGYQLGGEGKITGLADE